MTDDTLPIGERLKEEFFKYGVISGYLLVCFSVLLIYETSVEGMGKPVPVHWSLAVVKALVLGKFILIGDALAIGSRADSSHLMHRIFWKSLAMLALLIVLKAAEELCVGWYHGIATAQVVHEFLQKSPISIIAPLLLMLLILIPLLSITEVYRALGAQQFREHLSRL